MKMMTMLLSILLWTTVLTPNANAYIFTKPVKVKKAHRQINKSSRKALNPDSIKVMVWNIHKGNDKGFKEDFLEYGADRDVFMIQEMYQQDKVSDTLAAMPEVRFDVGISFKYRFKKGKPYSGTMIGSTVEPSYVALSRSKDKEPVVMTYKVLTIGKYPIEGHDDLMIINIHGMNVTSNKAFYRQINDAINAMAGHTGPIIFAGDFNTNRQPRIDYLQRNLVKRMGFEDMQFRNDERMRSAITNLTIDFTFTRGLETIDSEVLGHLKSSDHKAMYFEVAVK
jgi:endonuclease/exonuclease/phosphatase (EEP) superfamily protein YafD